MCIKFKSFRHNRFSDITFLASTPTSSLSEGFLWYCFFSSVLKWANNSFTYCRTLVWYSINLYFIYNVHLYNFLLDQLYNEMTLNDVTLLKNLQYDECEHENKNLVGKTSNNNKPENFIVNYLHHSSSYWWVMVGPPLLSWSQSPCPRQESTAHWQPWRFPGHHTPLSTPPHQVMCSCLVWSAPSESPC